MGEMRKSSRRFCRPGPVSGRGNHQAAGPAVYTLTFAIFRDGKYRREGSFRFGKSGISVLIGDDMGIIL